MDLLSKLRGGLVVMLIAACAIAVNGQAPAGGRAMTVEDLIVAPRVSDPQLSPDGKTVLFVRTTTEPKSGRRNADIYSISAEGSEPKPLFVGDKNENTPRWSADGRKVAFLSNRDGATQVYVADADGKNVKKVTALSAGAQPPLVWAPDGSRLAFVSDVYPECADEECNKRKKDEAEQNPVKVHRLTRLLYRHWDEWRENIRHHVFVTPAVAGRSRDLTPGDFDSPPTQQEDASIAFSPDGRTVAFVSNREGIDKEAWTTNNDVWLVATDGGEARKLTPNPAADTHPVFSRDGKTVFVLAQRRPGFESDRWYLDAYDLAGGTKRTVFTTPDISVSDFTLDAEGRKIWFTAADEGRDNLFSVPAAGGAAESILLGGSISSPQPAAGFIVFAKSSLTSPPEIFRAATDGSGVKKLTDLAKPWISRVAFTEPESMTVSMMAGKEKSNIQYWLVKPPNFDPAKKYPVVFLIHGGPQGAWQDAWSTRWNPSLWAAQGWVVAAPNPSGSKGFGQPMVDRISGDWGGRVMTEIDAVVAAVSKMPFVDPQRLGIAGASYGGYAVNWILGVQPAKFKAAVTHDGVYNLDSMTTVTEELWFTDWEFGGKPWDPKVRALLSKWSPHLNGHKIKTPTLIITNELDYRVPVDQGLQMFTVLKRNGVPTEALVFPDEGHWVLKAGNSRVWHDAVFAWMKKYL
jgi:dipeptidyl aminopeptidase/acylaminoacyl peptidase